MDPATRHVSLVLVELGRAVKARSLLRAGEPRLEETLERAHFACAAELARAGVLELVMDGRLLRLGHGGPRLTIAPAVELARICKDRGLLGVRLDKDLELQAFCALVESLADTPESRRPAGAAKRRNVPTPPREIDPAEIEAALEGSVEEAIEDADPSPAAASRTPLDDALGEPLQEELPDALLSALPPAEREDEVEPDPLAAAGPGLGIEPDAVALGEERTVAGADTEEAPEADEPAGTDGAALGPAAIADSEPIPEPEPVAVPEPIAVPEPVALAEPVAAPEPVAEHEPEAAVVAVVASPAPDEPEAEDDLPAPLTLGRPEPEPLLARALPPARGGAYANERDATPTQAPDPVPTPIPVASAAPQSAPAAGDELADMLRLASDAADRRGRSDEERLEATARLRALATGPRLEQLLQRACSDETPASLQASQVLLALGSEFIPKLLDAIAAEKHPKRRGHLNGILIAMGEAAAPHLVRELEVADPVRARTTAWLAGEIQHPAAVPALTARLRGGDPVLRREAAKALAKISHPSAISILVQTLEGKDAELAAQAAHCLAVSGRPHGLEAVRQRLHAACERNELPLAREMLLMLGRRGRADVVPDLVAILGRKSLLRRQSLRELKIAALHALSKLPGDEARAALADVAANGDTTIRDAAQGALARRDRSDPPAPPPPDAAS